MKKLFIISAIAISGLIYNTADAQMRFHAGFGFRPHVVVYAQPQVVVAPAPVYTEPAVVYNQPAVINDTANDYYYLPDVDAYYDVNDQCYVYYNGASWISAAYLPGAYANFDWRTANHYEIRAPHPYLNDNVYRERYNGHAGGFAQGNYNNHANNGYANNGQRGFSQPAQPARNQANYNQHFDNKGQGGYRQPSNENRDTRGGTEHFAQNNPQNGAARNRMTKF